MSPVKTRHPSPGGPGWAQYECLTCDAMVRYTIEGGVVADQTSARLGVPCHACGGLMLLDHVQFPIDVRGTTVAEYHAEPDNVPGETPEEKEDRLRMADAGIVWNGDDTPTN